MTQYVDETTLRKAVKQLQGTAGPYFPIWLVLKQMGFSDHDSVDIDTRNSTAALQRLFGYGSADGKFYFPMAHTPRFLTRASDSSRSVIQTNLKQWHDASGTVSPTAYLDIRTDGESSVLRVSAQRSYPNGLGFGRNGLALNDDVRVAMPRIAWAVWYGRQIAIPDDADPCHFLVDSMDSGLKMSDAERACVLRDVPLSVSTSATALTDQEIYEICTQEGQESWSAISIPDTLELNRERIALTQTTIAGPSWLNTSPEDQLRKLLDEGCTAVLLTGPPRTGKTRAVRQIVEDQNPKIIQIHDGWSYDHLILGQIIGTGGMDWESGSLLRALEQGHQYIVLEEANRTRLSQALGEVFSLLESAYRGPEHSVTLPNGDDISIPASTVFFFTVNNIDKSTEDLDDALFGRLRSVEFLPRVEDLRSILTAAGHTATQIDSLVSFFNGVQRYYPLGHGYFSQLKKGADLALFYVTAIRPVLANHFASFEPKNLLEIDNLFDEIVMHANNV